MSGITGILNLDGAPMDGQWLARMTDALSHRGPDRGGCWASGPAGLGHRLLVVTPEEATETQPYASASGSLAITADARIDNRDELLGLSNGDAGRSDAELILAAYEHWGEECPEHLLGDFAFVIWDGRRRMLFCARDQIGVRPFYYAIHNSRFLFSSDLRALLLAGGVPRLINERILGQHLADDHSDEENTLFTHILRLPPAHRMTVDAAGSIRKTCYWDVRLRQPIRYARHSEYVEQFRELFTDSVRCRLRSSGPVGAFLSGGLDSGSIVCMAQQLYEAAGAREKLRTVSAYFVNPSCDEREYIAEIQRRWPIQAHFHCMDGEAASDYAVELTEWFESTHEGVFFCMRSEAEQARQLGVRVALLGIGGDEWCTGSPFVFADLLRRGRLIEVHRQIGQFAGTLLLNRRQLWKSWTLMPLLPPWLANPVRRLRHRNDPGFPRWINPDFARRTGLAEHLRHRPPHIPVELSRLHLYRTLHGGYWAYVMEELQALGGRLGLEFRFPFADRRLVDYLLRIPGDQLLRGDLTKCVLREAMTGILPDAIRLRKTKTLFDAVVENDLRRPFYSSLLNSLQLASDGYVVAAEVEKLHRQVSQPGTMRSLLGYSLIALELWYRRQRSLNGAAVKTGATQDTVNTALTSSRP